MLSVVGPMKQKLWETQQGYMNLQANICSYTAPKSQATPQRCQHKQPSHDTHSHL